MARILKKKNSNVQRLLGIIDKYATKAQKTQKKANPNDFLIKLAIFFSNDQNEEEIFNANAIHLLTIHAAKGLEFDIVFLIGFEEEIIPFAKDRKDISDLNEERRLCYVAITRAKKECWLSFCEKRQYYGETIYCEPSRFLSEIPRECLREVDMSTEKKFILEKKKQKQDSVNQTGMESLRELLKKNK